MAKNKKSSAKPAKKAAKAKPAKKAKKAAPKKAAPAKKTIAKKIAKKKVVAKKVVAKKALPKKVIAKKSVVVKKQVQKKLSPAPKKPVSKTLIVQKKVTEKAVATPKRILEKVVATPQKVVAEKVVVATPKKIIDKTVAKPVPKKIEKIAAAPVKPTPPPAVVVKPAPPQLNIFPVPNQRPIAHKQNKPTSPADERTRYSENELQEFEALIILKMDKAKDEYRNLKETLNRNNDEGTDATSGGNTKVLEDGAETAEKENLSQLAGRQQKYIMNLENALVRIKNGTYGICSVTGKLIPKERLIAVPHTTQSIEAKMMQHD